MVFFVVMFSCLCRRSAMRAPKAMLAKMKVRTIDISAAFHNTI